MTIKHEKSACCGAVVRRRGGKRRSCASCGRTWRTHPAKRGRKARRAGNAAVRAVFSLGLKVRHTAERSRVTVRCAYARFGKGLAAFASAARAVRLGPGPLIVIVDARWGGFGGSRWTLHFVAVRRVSSDEATVLDPVLLPGKECADGWRAVLASLPDVLRKRAVALVSDGLCGIGRVARENGWVLQRCHFHLVAKLEKRRSRRRATPGREVREEVCVTVRRALSSPVGEALDRDLGRLSELAAHASCPRAMRMAVREFLRRVPEYGTFLSRPELRLPNTTCTMESVNAFTESRGRTLRTPESWWRWAVAAVRSRPMFMCRPAKIAPN